MKSFTTILSVLLTVVSADDRSIIDSVLREMFLNSTAGLCPTCGQKKFAIESILSENEIKKYRIELIKKSILDSLGLNKPPSIKAHNWPRPFEIGSFFNNFKTGENDGNAIGKIILMPRGKCSFGQPFMSLIISSLNNSK